MAMPTSRILIPGSQKTIRLKATRRSELARRRALGAHVPKVLLLRGESRLIARHDPLAARLRQAIVREELVLHYQPIVEASTQRLIGAEALLRWHAPELGEVSPRAMIPLAEQSGLIHALTLSVLNQALSQCRLWSRQHAPLRISVNLSPVCLKDETFPRRVAALLKAWSVPADSLTFELSARDRDLEDPAAAAEVLRALRSMGIRVLLDGFGSPSASLERLKQLPVDGLKIDRAYVSGFAAHPVDRAIVTALLQLARTLGCEAIATGVESEAAFTQLALAGCETLQGYWIGKPVPAEEFSQRWLTRPGSVAWISPSTPQR